MTAARLIATPGHEAALRTWLESHGTLVAAARAQPASERLEGRGAVWLAPAPGGEPGERWVVRHYHRGGALARILGDRYLRLGPSRPERELRTLTAVRRLGVPAPDPVGVALYDAGPLLYRGDLVTRWVPDSVDLATFLFHGPNAPPASASAAAASSAAAAMFAAGRLVRLLHDRGVVHRDLNLKNILLVGAGGPAPPAALVLDLDRATIRRRLGRRTRQSMIRRFWRSAKKWQRLSAHAKEVDALRAPFNEGYAAIEPGDGA